MKKLLYFAFFMNFAFFGTVNAETISIDWLNEDGTLSQTTTCEAGGDIILPSPPTKRGYTFLGWDAFTPIEYLEFTGTQYINTGIVGNNNIKVVVDINILGIQGWIFGARHTWSNRAFGLSIDPNPARYFINYSTGYQYKAVPSTSRHVITMDKNNFYEDGVLLNTFSPAVFTTPGTMYVGRCNGDGAAGLHAYMYYVKIYDNDVLVRDFVPVLDKDGVACMYDRVTSQFFYNAGTGDFIAGPTIGNQ